MADGVQRIHLNNSGAGLPSPEVLEAMIAHLRAEAELGPIEAARADVDATDALYDEAARLIGASPEEIAWCDSGSRAWATMIEAFSWKKRDRIIVSRLDYGGSLATLMASAHRTGATIESGPCDGYGRIIPAQLERLLATKPRAIAVSHAAAHSGATNDVVRIGELAKRAGVTFLVDATQSLGQLPVNVDEIGCDALCATGRKWLRGPRGSGFVYFRESTTTNLWPPWADVASAEVSVPSARTLRLGWRGGAKRFELWERSQAAAIGLGVALGQLNAAIAAGAAPFARIHELAQRCRNGLEFIGGVKMWGPPDPWSAVIGFDVEGVAPEVVSARCRSAGINISVMDASAAPLDFADHGVHRLCRVAPHATNSEADVDAFLDVIATVRYGS